MNAFWSCSWSFASYLGYWELILPALSLHFKERQGCFATRRVCEREERSLTSFTNTFHGFRLCTGKTCSRTALSRGVHGSDFYDSNRPTKFQTQPADHKQNIDPT